MVGLILSCTICWIYFSTFSGELSTDQTKWNAFGSYIGGTLGALFAFLSFMGLLYTISIQHKELATAVDALNKNAESQDKQAKTYKIQRFESTFYSLLEQHNQILKDLDFENVNTLSYVDLHQAITHSLTFTSPYAYLRMMQIQILKNAELSQYFRVLYQLLKFIAKNNIKNTALQFDKAYLRDKSTVNLNEHDEKMYASIVRSFVPVDLLPTLALNCTPSDIGLNNLDLYWEVIERYEFLEHLRFVNIPTDIKTFVILDGYDNAFGKNTTVEDAVLKIHSDNFYGHKDKITEGRALYRHVLKLQSS